MRYSKVEIGSATVLVRRKFPTNSSRNWNVSQPIYKYVDFDDAKYIESGSLRFGTLRGYGNLEDMLRRDADENTVTAIIDTAFSGDAEDNKALRKLGLLGGNGGQVMMFGGSMRRKGSNHYCFCASYRADLKEVTDKPQAIFAIEDVELWAHSVTRTHKFLGECGIAAVTYAERERNFRDGDFYNTDPFLKPLSFEREHEIRLLAFPKVSDDAQPICTPPDRFLARLMKRIQ